MNIGLIGYGNIAKKHELAISELDNLTLKAIFDTSSIEHSILTTDFSQFIESNLDLITVCTPNGYHKEHSIKALTSGHHVICEKPLALSSTDCTEMIATAKRMNKQLFCTMQNRYSPVSQWLKNVVDQNELGEIYLVNVACYWNRNKNYYQNSDWRGKAEIDGGTLYTQFSHYVDTIYWLFGEMNILNAHFKNFDHDDLIDFEDTGMFNFSLASGGMGTFSYTTSCYEKNYESSLTIIGSKGTIKVAGQYMDTVSYCNLENGQLPELENNDNIYNIRQVYKNALQEIHNNSTEFSSALDARKIVEIIEEVYSFKNQ